MMADDYQLDACQDVLNMAIGKMYSNVGLYGAQLCFDTLTTENALRVRHIPTCCEIMWLDRVDGELAWLAGPPILEAKITDTTPQQGTLELAALGVSHRLCECTVRYTLYFATSLGEVTIDWVITKPAECGNTRLHAEWIP